MANKRTDMSKLRQMIRLHGQGESKLKISRLTGVSRNTLKKYIKIYGFLGLSVPAVELMNDRDLDVLFGQNLLPLPSTRYQALEAIFPDIEKGLKKRGVTRQQLWEKYIAQYPEGYKVSQFKNHYNQWLRRSKPVMHIDHIAGDKMYIDYAGEKLHLVDEHTGEITNVEVFISVLGASQLTYIEATNSQSKEDFIGSCERALHYYGGVPKAIVPDNLKSAVTKSDRFEPTLNQSFENFALHYNTAILPARVYKPKDKSLVEGAVKIAYRRIYAILDKEVFHTLPALNKAISGLLETHNNTLLTDRPYSRRKLFEDIERVTLSPLPVFEYEFKRQQMSTISTNGHVCLKEDKHYYSVPYQYIGKKVKILYTLTHVEIFYNYASITIHRRNYKEYGYCTMPEHLASTHQYLAQWNPERFLQWAQTIDESVKTFVGQLLDSRMHPEQSYKACQGVLGFERKVGRERLINACKRAIEYQSYSYRTIKTILENKYDQLPVAEPLPDLPQHNNIRGGDYFQ